MSDVAQKIINSRSIQNGRAVIYTPGRAANAQFGGWSGTMLQVPLDATALENRLTTRFDEDGGPKDIVNTFTTVKNLVQTTAMPITGVAEGTQGLQLKAGASNTGIIYIGKSTVTAKTNQSTDGFPLSADQGFFVPINQTGVTYAIADGANQELFIFAV